MFFSITKYRTIFPKNAFFSYYSPQYLSQEDLEPGTIVMTDKEEENKREMDQASLFLLNLLNI